MLRALVLVARGIGAAHDRWRVAVARARPLSVEIAVLRGRTERLREENDLLRARLRRLEPHRRPHYRPWERLQILWHQPRHRLSLEATARAFVVSVQTLLNWKKDIASAAARIVRARRPVNALPDLVADLVHRLKREWPAWGTRRLAGVLARLGVEASRTTVQRMLRRRPRRPARTQTARKARGPLVAKRPGHLWFVDFTRVGGFFRSVVVGAVIDGFSRRVLAIAVAPREPTAAFAVRLFHRAVRESGRAPTWVVTDHGRQFTSKAFARAVARSGARRRFGAVGGSLSVSRIDRFWRSMKTEYARGLLLYRPLKTIEWLLLGYTTWFNAHRPHQGLGGRTPDEVHFGKSTGAKLVPLRAAVEV
jgi:putative transposase